MEKERPNYEEITQKMIKEKVEEEKAKFQHKEE